MLLIGSWCPNGDPELPDPPSNLQAVIVSGSQINLTWQDTSGDEDGFKIERKENGGSWSMIQQVGVGVEEYQDTGRSPETTYYYRVCAYRGNEHSAWSDEASATTPASPLVPPSNFQATAVSESQINLNWDDTPSEMGYIIESRMEGVSGFALLDSVGDDVTDYQDFSLQENTVYYYRICSYIDEIRSGYSFAHDTTLVSRF